MLAFFRKYQRFFFLVITVVIVISFTFFGTYSTLQRTHYVDKTAFTAIDGTEIGRQELEELVLFLGTDHEDKLLQGGRWDPNFLNDGVIKKDFLETGLAEILAEPYLQDLRSDLVLRHQKEKHYVPYVHPQAQFLSATNAWNVVAPDINQYLIALRAIEDPADIEGFSTRVELFLAERRFPHTALRFVLRHQQKQYGWVSPDPNLDRMNLSLFDYHTATDWFGSRFMRLVAEFIINSAIIAEERGYEVSKGEVLADLYRNAEVSYQQNINNPGLGVASTDQYFAEQLRRLGMDQSKAINVWRQVMLFRRLFHDMGNSVMVDPLTIRQFYDYAKETVEGDLYQVPEELRLGDYRALQKFEIYLNAVSQRPTTGMEMLELPESFKKPEEVAQEYPELVQRRYFLEHAKVDKKTLQAKVGIKETWDWEVQDDNWEKLKNKFPELGVKQGSTEDERYAALDELDKKTRARVDSFSRSQIVEEHPEWLSEALQEATTERSVVGIRKKGESEVFGSLSDPQGLIDLLDIYPESKEELDAFTTDNNTYWRITVLDKSPDFEVLTFAEADKSNILEKIAERELSIFYQQLKKTNPGKYQKEDGSWKEFYQVRNDVADKYFANILTEIKNYYSAVTEPEEKPKAMIGDYAASLRLFAFMRGLREQFRQDSAEIIEWIKEPQQETQDGKLPPRSDLAEQWKIEQTEYQVDRSAGDVPIDREEMFALQPDEWTKVYSRANGNSSFFQLKQKKDDSDTVGLFEKTMRVHQTLSNDAQKVLMHHLLADMKEQNALSLKFLDRAQQE